MENPGDWELGVVDHIINHTNADFEAQAKRITEVLTKSEVSIAYDAIRIDVENQLFTLEMMAWIVGRKNVYDKVKELLSIL